MPIFPDVARPTAESGGNRCQPMPWCSSWCPASAVAVALMVRGCPPLEEGVFRSTSLARTFEGQQVVFPRELLVLTPRHDVDQENRRTDEQRRRRTNCVAGRKALLLGAVRAVRDELAHRPDDGHPAPAAPAGAGDAPGLPLQEPVRPGLRVGPAQGAD